MDVTYLSFIASLIAIIFAWISVRIAKKALALALFDRRFSLYNRFMLLVNKIMTMDIALFNDCLNETKFILWEAKYIFGNEFCELLDQIKCELSGCWAYHSVDSPEDRKVYKSHRSNLLEILGLLVGSDKSKNLDSYFHDYLFDKQFRKPIRCGFKLKCGTFTG